MALKRAVFNRVSEGDPLDTQAVRCNLLLYLYSQGEYENWCQQWGYDPSQYWLDTFGKDYLDHCSHVLIPQDGSADAVASIGVDDREDSPEGNMLRRLWTDFFGD